MFKSIVSGLIAVGVLVTPVVAEAGHRDDRRIEHRHRGLNTGEAIALGLGAVIVGSIIDSRRDRRFNDRDVRGDYRDRYYYDYNDRPARCDRWVERVYDRRGRVHYVDRVRCF